MKADLDRLMRARQLDAIVVAGGEGYSAVRDYMVNGADITHALIFKKLDAEPLIIVSGMEIEEARKAGLSAQTYGETGLAQLLHEIDDPRRAQRLFWEQCLRAIGLTSGTVGVYGQGAINEYLAFVGQLAADYPQYTFTGEEGVTLFQEAMLTKDAAEIERLRSVAARTVDVLEATWDFIAGHRAEGETVVNAEGDALTIGAVKRFVRRALMDRDLEDTGMIFAQGRDAGFPHSRGEAQQALKLGQTIVFDLFPRELGGGYHHDVTRTWCIGHAPEAAQRLYDEVKAAFDISVENFALGRATQDMQVAVLDYFESKGHPTQRSEPGTMQGYVHGLGHGIGLNIHERPRLSHIDSQDVWQVGNVVTIEPGLYYPDEGYGVRVEDTFIVTEAGELVSITPFRQDLVLPLRG